MFTQSCFIEKDTQELRDKLKQLGYRPIQSIISNKGEMIFANAGFFSNNLPYNARLIDESVDCGTNEELFLALASLRDDSDKNQWFVVTGKNGTKFVKSVEDRFTYDASHFIWHKATPEELIEYFKEK